MQEEVTGIAEIIPMNAWDQAVIVVLFTLIIIYVLGWVARREKESQNFLIDLVKRQDRQIEDRDSRLTEWISRQNSDYQTTFSRVVDTLNIIIDKIDLHDEHADELINLALTRVEDSIKTNQLERTESANRKKRKEE